MSFPCLQQLILVSRTCNWSEVLRQLWTMVSQPWGSNRRNVIFPWITAGRLHPMTPQCLKTSSNFFLQSLLGTHRTSFCPLQHVSQLSKLLHMKKRSKFLLSSTKVFYPDSPCQEQLCSLLHQSSWLHHKWDSVKVHRGFPQVKTYTSELVYSQVCDIQRTDTRLSQWSLSWYPHSLKLNPSLTEKVQMNLMWALHWTWEEFLQVYTSYILLLASGCGRLNVLEQLNVLWILLS